jgi:hypothetical protein
VRAQYSESNRTATARKRYHEHRTLRTLPGGRGSVKKCDNVA